MMAAPSSSSVDHRLLVCSLCGKIFNEPRLLPCLHIFCAPCLQQHVQQQRQQLQEQQVRAQVLECRLLPGNSQPLTHNNTQTAGIQL